MVGGPALSTAGLTIPAAAPRPVSLTAVSWLVADLDSGAVLGGCGPHEYGTPASVQKLLLAAAVMPDLDPARVIEVTRADLDFEPGSSAMGLVEGGRYSIETLWLGLLLNSGNDAANVLARVGGGPDGLAGGIQAMNAKARRLGAYQTHAVTPSGLDGPGQFTSAYDLALIARACFAREDFRRYVATQEARVPAQPTDPRGFAMQNDNKLLTRYPGMLGGKTGFTDLARQTYVGAAERGGRRLVVTLLGAESQPLGLYQEATSLLDWGFGLPRDSAVGHLVTADETGSTPTPAVAARRPVDPIGAARVSGWSPFAVTSLAVAAAAVLLFLLVLTGRWVVRARSAASGRSRADRQD
jgi:D-alanyl-D-alanine carboxypeptidase (penicillin-binding protein 5/6)